MDVARCGLRAFLKAGVAERVHHDMVAGADQPLDHAEARRPAGRKQRDMIGLEKISDCLFELYRQRGVANQRG